MSTISKMEGIIMKNIVEISRINKVVKFSKTTVNILMFICILTIVVSSFTAVCALFKPYFTLDTDKIPLQALKNIVNFSSSTVNPNLTTRYMTIVFMMGYILYSIFVIVILKSLLKVLSSVTDGTPFSENNWKIFSFIGWWFIIAHILITFIQRLIGSVMLGMIKVKEPLIRVGSNTDWLLVLFMIFAGLLILIFAQVFKYGTYLQNEYDSTL